MVAAAGPELAAGAPLSLPGASLTALQLALLHVAAYTLLFTAADAFLGWRRSRGQATLSPKPPSRAAVARERLRTLGSALVDAAYYWLLLRHGSFHRVPDTAAGLGQLTFFGAGLFLFADAHFYVTHRLLHWGPLYRHVHYVHHQSVNPGAWSSLSFHPIEAAIFFSVHLPMLLLPTPRNLFLIYKVGLVVGPLHAHCGVDLGNPHECFPRCRLDALRNLACGQARCCTAPSTTTSTTATSEETLGVICRWIGCVGRGCGGTARSAARRPRPRGTDSTWLAGGGGSNGNTVDSLVLCIFCVLLHRGHF